MRGLSYVLVHGNIDVRPPRPEVRFKRCCVAIKFKPSAPVVFRLDAREKAQAIAGAGMGCLMCYGSKVGWYHRVFLPVIVLELSGGQGSIWGAMDLCALCMIAAGEPCLVDDIDHEASKRHPTFAIHFYTNCVLCDCSGGVYMWLHTHRNEMMLPSRVFKRVYCSATQRGASCLGLV